MFDEPVQGDALQETFINTVPAWINMLLLSSSGKQIEMLTYIYCL